MKKILKIFLTTLLAVTMVGGAFTVLAGCNVSKKDVFTIAVFDGGRGTSFMDSLVEEFKKTYDGEIEVIKGGADLGDTITKRINERFAPDFIYMSAGHPSGVIERLIKGDSLENLTSLLGETVDGAKLEDKLVDNILSNYVTQPKGDGQTYLLPLFYSPTGLWYSAEKFGEGKLTLPKTWDEYWALGDSLPNGTSLFTIPTPGYLDGFMFAEMANYTGTQGFVDAMKFSDGYWEKAESKAMLAQIGKLTDYFTPNTIDNALTKGGHMLNQQAVIDGEALFVPNGDWLPGEMIPANTSDANYDKNKNFKWGFTAYPMKDAATQGHVNTYLETISIHKDADKKDAAKEFAKLIYSDKGAEIIAKDAKAKAIIPTKKALEMAKTWGVPQGTIDLYDVFKTNGAVTGGTIAYKEVLDLIFNDVLFNKTPVDVWKKTKTVENWAAELEKAADQIRPNIGKS